LSLRIVARRVARLEARRRFVSADSPFTFDVDTLDDEERPVIRDAQALLARDGVLFDGVLAWEMLTASERALCTRAADIILQHRKDAEDRHLRMH
jgi:hypothetical protein